MDVPRGAGRGNIGGIGMLFEKRSWEPYFRITGLLENVSLRGGQLASSCVMMLVCVAVPAELLSTVGLSRALDFGKRAYYMLVGVAET